MENKINIAEILRNCPQGMELYSPLCGKCVFDRLNMGTIICKKQNTQEITFTSEGYYMLPVFDDCECMLFPSKDQRDWSKFQRPFKDGNIIATNTGAICIFKKEGKIGGTVNYYCGICEDGDFSVKENTIGHFGEIIDYRLATEEEKAKLFKAIKEHGYKWNAETKTLEKLIVPKFKVGDRIKKKGENSTFTITDVNEAHYFCGKYVICDTCDNNWELVPNKFDINTLVPFESRVLVRNSKDQYWIPAFWGYKTKDGYVTTFGHCNYCIPFEANEHLLGTTGDCDGYFKTW